MAFFSRLSLILALGVASAGASAHEVWLEPENWVVAEQEPVTARLRNGEYFKGIELIWNDRSVVRAERWDNLGVQPIAGRLGDRPALATTAERDGLLTLLYKSSINTVDYTEYDKFAEFLAEKGYEAILQQHAARRLPQAPIREAYSRYAKALVAVGSGQGADAPRGLEIELVALSNPYTSDPDAEMRFQAVYQGKPLADNQVTIFAKAPDGTVETSYRTTDDAGTVSIDTVPGHAYLIDTVLVREPNRAVAARTRGAVWESLWASLTFRVPPRQ